MSGAISGLRSMTGYAAATAQQDGFALTVSVRSVNHRYLDLRVHLPEVLLPLEREARSAVQAMNPRGHVEVKASLEFQGGGEFSVDEALAARYLEVFRRLGAAHGLAAQVDAVGLAQLPGVVSRQVAGEGSEAPAQLAAVFRELLRQALQGWDRMRADEAALLAADLKRRLKELGRTAAQVEEWLQQSLVQARQKLAERLQQALKPVLAMNPAAASALDAARLAQEAVLLAERSDPTEEIQRLKAHVQQFDALLGEPDAGRKLDFLLQEMQREANTLLAKVSGLGVSSLPLTDLGVAMKAEIEKLREQVQNLQ